MKNLTISSDPEIFSIITESLALSLIEGRLSYYDDWVKLDRQFQKAIAAKAAGLIASDDPQSVFVLLAGLGINPYSG
jgi:hypothetical protein